MTSMPFENLERLKCPMIDGDPVKCKIMAFFLGEAAHEHGCDGNSRRRIQTPRTRAVFDSKCRKHRISEIVFQFSYEPTITLPFDRTKGLAEKVKEGLQKSWH
ncbi:hypothetical protein QFZ94_006674 [Paraburkholderia sp. JPY465]|uniref:hypothetical protein n=1 Tax=Paraburkholderia sp. JPY465 TaxID=3042285 RepID=UPI003D21DD42